MYFYFLLGSTALALGLECVQFFRDIELCSLERANLVHSLQRIGILNAGMAAIYIYAVYAHTYTFLFPTDDAVPIVLAATATLTFFDLLLQAAVLRVMFHCARAPSAPIRFAWTEETVPKFSDRVGLGLTWLAGTATAYGARVRYGWSIMWVPVFITALVQADRALSMLLAAARLLRLAYNVRARDVEFTLD